MALVICPECAKEISSKALSCPNCGYPISTDCESNSIQLSVMRKGYRTKYNRWLFEINELNNSVPSDVFFANSEVVFLDNAMNEISSAVISTVAEVSSISILTLGFDNLSAEIAEKVQYIKKTVNTPVCQSRTMQQIMTLTKDGTIIKCPTCGSTNVKRVSLLSKAVNVELFGLFGNKRNKQFKCTNCKYMW